MYVSEWPRPVVSYMAFVHERQAGKRNVTEGILLQLIKAIQKLYGTRSVCASWHFLVKKRIQYLLVFCARRVKFNEHLLWQDMNNVYITPL